MYKRQCKAYFEDKLRISLHYEEITTTNIYKMTDEKVDSSNTNY